MLGVVVDVAVDGGGVLVAEARVVVADVAYRAVVEVAHSVAAADVVVGVDAVVVVVEFVGGGDGGGGGVVA